MLINLRNNLNQTNNNNNNNYYYSSANESNDESTATESNYSRRLNRNYYHRHQANNQQPTVNQRVLLVHEGLGPEAAAAMAAAAEEQQRRVSYASITLRQPVKDVNYFSDTEALGGLRGRSSAFRKPISVRYQTSNSSSRNYLDQQQQEAAHFSVDSPRRRVGGGREKNNNNEDEEEELFVLFNNNNNNNNNNASRNNSSTNNYFRAHSAGRATNQNAALRSNTSLLQLQHELSNLNKHNNNYNNQARIISSNNNNNNYNNSSLFENHNTRSSSNHNHNHHFEQHEHQQQQQHHFVHHQHHTNYFDYFSNIFLNNSSNNNNNNNNEQRMNQSYLANNNNNNSNMMFNISTATDFNRKPHGFSKLSSFGSTPQQQPTTTSQFTSTSSPQTLATTHQSIQLPVQFAVQPRSTGTTTVVNQVPRGFGVNPVPNQQQQQQSYYNHHSQPQQQQQQQPPPPPPPPPQQIYAQPTMWTPSSSNQHHHHHQQNSNYRAPVAALDDDIDDPVVEKYEREMGSELAKPSSNKRNYADSYFYNSPVFNYPTIDEQKKLAKSIAETLEGSNPATSKYHKKKQTIMKQMAAKEAAAAAAAGGYDSDHGHQGGPQSPGYYPSDHDNNDYIDPARLAALDNDSSIPDVIKRSIVKASMIDPVRMVQAPDNFRQQHYTEHVTHTEMPPRAAMSLAAALESESGARGGRGAQIFQRRKAKSEKWVVDETNVKRPPGQQYYPPPSPQPSVYQPPKPVYIETPPPPPAPQPRLDNVNFGDYNAKPRGWSNNPNDIPRQTLSPIPQPPQPQPQPQPPQQYASPSPNNFDSSRSTVPTLVYSPNKLDVSGWSQPRSPQPQRSTVEFAMSKDGVESLKARLYDNSPQQQQPQRNFKKLSSHQNYLFNNKNAVNALKNTTNQQYYNNNNNNNNQYYNQSDFYDDNIAASDL